MVENLPCNTGDVGSVPDQGTKPVHSGIHAPQLESAHTIAEIPCATTETLRSQVNKEIFLKEKKECWSQVPILSCLYSICS